MAYLTPLDHTDFRLDAIRLRVGFFGEITTEDARAEARRMSQLERSLNYPPGVSDKDFNDDPDGIADDYGEEDDPPAQRAINYPDPETAPTDAELDELP